MLYKSVRGREQTSYMENKIVTFFKTKSEIEKDCIEWASEIEKTYKPDIIVFIAKSGFLFARPLAEYFKCEMVDVAVSRLDNSQKDIIKRFIPCMPNSLLSFFLKRRVSNPKYREFSERILVDTSRFEKINIGGYNQILIVDDSVDTGWSLIKVKDLLETRGARGKFRTASYCVLTESKNQTSVEYFRYTDTIVITATSRYNKEYSNFIDNYKMWKTQMNEKLRLREK